MDMELHSGIDLIEVSRLRAAVERYGKRFLERIFTPLELDECGGQVGSLAGRFAAKEAAVKALGCGIGVVSWQELEIHRGENGKPVLCLYGAADRLAHACGLTGWSVSLSHTHEYAIAIVVAVGLK
jgi:holo-[acyl-carrier protein] synthase